MTVPSSSAKLPASVASRLMKGLTAQERAMTSAVLGYPKSAIGRYMSPEVLALHEDWTAARAMEVVRARIDGPETVYLLPVVGPGRVLRGVVSPAQPHRRRSRHHRRGHGP
jgi:magnesium transporter